MVLPAAPVRAQEIKQIATPPPLAKAGAATVYLGEEAEVTLRVAGRVVEPMKFLIRKPPKLGDLGEVRRTGRNTAVVTYTPHAGAVASDDSFTFAAQSSDSPVSAPASIWVRLVERPPVLEYPRELEFGTVYLGDTAARELVLGNTGGGRAIGQMRVNPPWQVEGLANYQILAGSRIRKRVLFSPGEERDFSERLLLGGGETIELRGSAVAPITWPKAGVVLTPELRVAGGGVLMLTNRTSDERTVAIQWPSGWQGPVEGVVPGGATVSLPVSFSSPLKSAREDRAAIQCGNFSAEVPLKVFPKAAILRIEPSPKIELRPSHDGDEWKAGFVVRNSGEADGVFSVVVPEGCLVTPDPGRVVIDGGASQEFAVTAPRFQRGPLLGDLVLVPRGGEALRVALGVSAEGVGAGTNPAQGTSATPEAVAPSPGAARPVENFLSLPEPAVPAGGVPPGAGLSAVKSAELHFARPHELEIGWDIPSPDIVRFQIQRRQISPGQKEGVRVEWIPWTNLKIRIEDGKASALIENLADNTFWTIRIVGFNAAGQAGPPSPAFQVGTPAARKFRLPLWAWWLLVVLLACVVARQVVKRRHRLLAIEDERIERLQRAGGAGNAKRAGGT